MQQGHIDFPLTSEGEENALLLGDLLKQHKWSRVYSSDLGRALRTTEILLSRSQVSPPEPNPTHLIREVSYGFLEALPIHCSFDEAREHRAKERGVPVEQIEDDRESLESVLDRQNRFLSQLLEELEASIEHQNPQVLCVTHGGFIKRFLRNHCRLHLEEKIENCSVSLVRVRRGQDGQIDCVASKDEINLLNDSTVIP